MSDDQLSGRAPSPTTIIADQDPRSREPLKAEWPPGPWHDEPDHVDFEHAGFPCILHRNPLGVWCGYVGVPAGHPWHGQHYDHVKSRGGDHPDVHGGLTYGAPCQGPICHVGEPDDHRYWLGFDCGHYRDLMPGMEALRARWAKEDLAFAAMAGKLKGFELSYRDLGYVRRETEKLAEQAAEVGFEGEG